MAEEQRDPLVAQAYSHVEDRASIHDEGATSYPTYVDYEDDDTAAPPAPLAVCSMRSMTPAPLTYRSMAYTLRMLIMLRVC
jgi:hypothetical protein